MADDSEVPAFVIKRGAKKKGPETRFLGYVELWTDSKIKGWAVRKTGDKFEMTTVAIQGSLKSIKTQAKLERSDMYGEFGVFFGGFEFDLDRAYLGDIERVYFEESNENLPKIVANASIDKFEGPLIKGWASDTTKTVVEVSLFADGVKAKSVNCDVLRPELYGELGSRACIGFGMRVPGYLRDGNVHQIELRVSGSPFTAPMPKRFGPLRVLIVSESEAWEDASRYYRCDNLKLMLNMRGMEASVIGATEFHEKDWSNYDIVVMARVKMTDELEKKIVEHKRKFRTTFVFEIDDLIFLPWHINDMGSVRSGVDVKDDPNIEALFGARLRSIKLCDFGITTTDKIAGILTDLGLNTLIVRNALRIEQIEETKSRGSVLSILCMAGSPTHYADFAIVEPELRLFMDQHRQSAKLTLLGRFKDDLPILKLPNVKSLPRQTYNDMLSVVAQHDICLVPLETTEFNHAKSCLKYVECGSRSVPIIVSPVDDYVRAIHDGENGLIARKPGDWMRHLEKVLANRTHLRRMGEKARKDVVANYTVQALADNVATWFETEVAK